MDGDHEQRMAPDMLAAVLTSCGVLLAFVGYGFFNGSPIDSRTNLDLVGYAIAGLIWVVFGVLRAVAWVRRLDDGRSSYR